MSEVGAGWWKPKKDRNGAMVKDEGGGQVYQLSVSLRIPFLGEMNLTMAPNPEKRKAGAKPSTPDYIAYWWPPRKQDGGGSGYAPQGPQGPTGADSEYHEDAY
jgi:hypothetical protein